MSCCWDILARDFWRAGVEPSSKRIRVEEPAEGSEFASSCFLPTDWIELPLVSSSAYNHDSKVFEFGLPEGKSLNLPTCACLLVAVKNGEELTVRPYTPISPNSMTGKFQLLIKNYPGGNVSSFMHKMAIGDKLRFKHIKFNIKEQYPFGKKTISMITGGTGITPMLQALHMLLTTSDDQTQIVMLNGNRGPKDVLMKERLTEYAQKYGNRFKLVNIVGTSPDDKPAGWDVVPPEANYVAETGWIDEEKVKKYCYPPSEDTSVFICGLPVLYSAMCGPRSEKEVAAGTILQKLGYTSSMVTKF